MPRRPSGRFRGTTPRPTSDTVSLLRDKGPTAIRGATVGIIDDEVLIAHALKRILEGLGYVVTALAHTVEDAIALAERTGECNLVFINPLLPGLTPAIDTARRSTRTR